jgi:beta-lactamase class A
LHRRTFLLGSLAAGVTLASRPLYAGTPLAEDEPLKRLATLEKINGGRLGVAILDTATGRRINHRGEERFPMCSTFKWLAASEVLSRVDRGTESLARRIEFTESDLVSYSPVTSKHLGAPGMTLAEICEAAITLSDNTAGNLLLDSMGGPAGLTAFARSLGDRYTRLDRRETELNEAIPGDPRDTTTPAAMLHDMHALLVGDALSEASRTQLIAWMVATTTGDARLRAGFPHGWRVGDKTGTSNNGVANDVAIAWPPGRATLLVAAYYAEADTDGDTRNAVLAEVGRIAATLAAPAG